ncbi:2Fe-2S iron-sulfur cluster-binding protein [Acidiphilium sp. PA]|uniref:2Fe-2S iron-sulfur cluster-binding protein n=1 Tax=Acidiphilium sp. PA TaxID=2871705 RepID=UPI002243C977|nr:2Fe-2S iron-sulfur cluster-binding protein [Acidiphilium sp. PA]MCW8305824.1 2Fe-2S iron-sulfur cluster-binding protein [Acidiphilium sp. PA]
MPALLIVDRVGTKHKLTAATNDNVMQIARAAGLPVAGDCNGSMACATCHVIVAPDWADRLTPPDDDEEATLDTLFNLAPTSRLGCQIRMTDALDGLTVRLPDR